MAAESNNRGDREQETHPGGDLSSTLTPLLFQEGFSIDHDGNMISTWYVDFRMPHERSPIGAVIKFCEAEFAIERSSTIKLTRPPHYRKEGETLIYDQREGLATKESVVQREVPISDDEQARTQSLNDDINRALELSGAEGVRINRTLKGRTVTDTDRDSFEWGNDFWLFCTAIESTCEDEARALLESLDPNYDHESYVPSPRTFAQMLARAYVDEYGAPLDAEEPFEHTINGVYAGRTYHRKMLVAHGPVMYVDDPNTTCISAMDSQNPLIRTMLPLFVKGKEYSGQREYRFVMLDKTPNENDWKIMPATPMLVAAIGRRGDCRGPMLVPAFDTTRAEAAPPETTSPPPLGNLSRPLIAAAEMAELNSASPAIPDRHRVASDEEPPDDLHETVGLYPAVATLHEKIDHALFGIATSQPERKPYVTSAAWYAERSIRRLCQRFGDPITGISVTGDNSIVIDIRLPHWRESEGKLAVMPSGAYALTLKKKKIGGDMQTTHSSCPISGTHGMATSLDGLALDTIASFELPTSQAD